MAASSTTSTVMTSASRLHHNQQATIRVLAAETGAVYSIFLSFSELTVNNIRSHLAAAVPLSDQILLLGPPYKVPKDKDLQSDDVLTSLRLGDMEDDPIQEEPDTSIQGGLQLKLPRRRLLGSLSSASSSISSITSQQQQQHQQPHRVIARRLFLFSKSTFSSSDRTNAAAPPCVLYPGDISLPSGDVPGPSPLDEALTNSSITASPLHQALVAYESQFRKYLEQGRILADAADLRVNSCIVCLQEQSVMARALQAAVSNLTDHSAAAARTRKEFTNLFQERTVPHAQLLSDFERILQQLSTITLHPTLIQQASIRHASAAAAAANTSMASALSTAFQSPHRMTTLLDTVPVERERNWMKQCQSAHNRLLTLFQEMEVDFSRFTSIIADSFEVDTQFNLNLELKWEQMQGTGKAVQMQQARRLDHLTASHSQVVKIILQALSSTHQETAVQEAFVPLGELSETSKCLIPEMIQADLELKQMQQVVADSKYESGRRLKTRLREISAAQSGIQKALSNLSVLRDALKHQCENMEHIEHVAELSASYQHFLLEIQRRRAYGHAVAASSTALMERIAAMREDEIKAREKFLHGPGRHLMPAFYEVFIPTLASPPPLFAPQLPLNEIDLLPDVSGVVVSSGIEGGFSSMQIAEPGVGSASTLTTSGQQPQPDDQEMPNAVVSASQLQPQDQLIVSASEQSGNDLYLDPAAGAAAEAEARTLTYENFMLRQALERLGGKPPRSYIQESARISNAEGSSGTTAAVALVREEKAQMELRALRKELAESNARADAVTDTLKSLGSSVSEPSASDPSVLSDKISHSSFQVGDVGLFMPTGRGSGGKRTYLAFHTKCPYRFLSVDNIKGTPDFVLGRIIYQEELVAGELGTDGNPYGLPVGTTFWVLTVEVLTSQT